MFRPSSGCSCAEPGCAWISRDERERLLDRVVAQLAQRAVDGRRALDVDPHLDEPAFGEPHAELGPLQTDHEPRPQRRRHGERALAAALLVDAEADRDGERRDRDAGVLRHQQREQRRHDAPLVVLRPEPDDQVAADLDGAVPVPRRADRVDVRGQQQLGALAPPDEQVVRRALHRLPVGGQPELGAARDQVIDGLVLLVGERRDGHEIDQLPACQVGPFGEVAGGSIDGAIAYCLPLTEMTAEPRIADRPRRGAGARPRPAPSRVHGPPPGPVHHEHPGARSPTPTEPTGLGQFDSDSYGAFDLAPLETLRTLAPRLIGRDPLERVATWDEIRDHGTAPDMPGVRSALDIAQWDLVARRAGVPLHELIAPRPAGAAPDRLARVRLAPHAREPGRVRGGRGAIPGRGLHGLQDPRVGRRGARPRGDPRRARCRRATTWRSSTTRRGASIVRRRSG